MSRQLLYPVTIRDSTGEAFLQVGDRILVVDKEDLVHLEGLKIFINTNGYAVIQFKQSLMGVHRWVALKAGWNIKGKTIDHRNGMRLDCRKANLQPVTHQYNNIKRRKPEDQDLPTGVLRIVRKSGVIRYAAQTHYEGHTIHCGTFDEPYEAYEARQAKINELWRGTRDEYSR